MSFSGKKFRRIAYENIEELVKLSDNKETKEVLTQIIKCNAPIFSFKRLDNETFCITIEINGRTLSHIFKLGQEHEMEKLDGNKIIMKFTLESDNVLIQLIKRPNSKDVQFRRVFQEDKAEMIITIIGTDVKAKIKYELVS